MDQHQQDQDNNHSKFRELQAKQGEENILLRAENKQMRAQLEVAVTGQHGELDEKDIALNAEQKDKLKTSRKYKAKI